MTIAFNGSTLSAEVSSLRVCREGRCCCLFPQSRKLKLTTLLFIQVMLGREQWRFNYYRKCYKEKLERVGGSIAGDKWEHRRSRNRESE